MPREPIFDARPWHLLKESARIPWRALPVITGTVPSVTGKGVPSARLRAGRENGSRKRFLADQAAQHFRGAMNPNLDRAGCKPKRGSRLGDRKALFANQL